MDISDIGSFFIQRLQSELIPGVTDIIIAISPVALAVILFVIMWDLWIDYIRSANFLSTKYTLLELRLPKDTFKSPLAMETFLNSLHNPADGNKFVQYWKGETRPWYSLEIVSIEGIVKFFIWTEDRRKTNLMSGLYSQYPEIEIKEVEDYAKSVNFDPALIRIWAAEFKFTMDDAYPIKTYVDYGLDKDPKEEYKVDPMLPMIEFLGSVPANQQVWIQILIMAHRKKTKLGKWFKQVDLWEEGAKKIVNEILMRDKDTKVAGIKDEKTGFTKLPSISKGEENISSAIERSLSKHAFDVGIRTLYIAPKDTFNTPFGMGGIIGSFKHFSAPHMNGIKQNGDIWHGLLEYPWQDYKNIRRNRYAKLALMAYKRRSYFFTPFERSKPLVMNSEELATIYHFPGSVAATPGLERVPSKKAEAPVNLPI